MVSDIYAILKLTKNVEKLNKGVPNCKILMKLRNTRINFSQHWPLAWNYAKKL